MAVTAEWWRREAELCRRDGHPHAAVAAMAQALFSDGLATDPDRAKIEDPAAWVELVRYASALGVDVLSKRSN